MDGTTVQHAKKLYKSTRYGSSGLKNLLPVLLPVSYNPVYSTNLHLLRCAICGRGFESRKGIRTILGAVSDAQQGIHCDDL